jgi:hypothetical protein
LSGGRNKDARACVAEAVEDVVEDHAFKVEQGENLML